MRELPLGVIVPLQLLNRGITRFCDKDITSVFKCAAKYALFPSVPAFLRKFTYKFTFSVFYFIIIFIFLSGLP